MEDRHEIFRNSPRAVGGDCCGLEKSCDDYLGKPIPHRIYKAQVLGGIPRYMPPSCSHIQKIPNWAVPCTELALSRLQKVLRAFWESFLYIYSLFASVYETDRILHRRMFVSSLSWNVRWELSTRSTTAIRVTIGDLCAWG